MSDSNILRKHSSHPNVTWKKLLAFHLVFAGSMCVIAQNAATAQSSFIGPAGSSINNPSSIQPGERILVLRTGRVMKGRIKTISTGWLISTDRGNAVIPFEQVHLDADDLHGAYLRLRIQNGRPTVASHLRLAEWCLSQNILAEAARELRDALEKDPVNETARLMLNRIDNEIHRRTPQPEPSEQPTDVVILRKRETEVPDNEVQSLSGLSPDTAREFVASIQPLLLNKCGNARCHGSAAKNEFKLTKLRSGSGNSRIVSERNLAAVLKDLQPGPNNRTRLTKIVRGTHVGKTIFNGRYGTVQMATLQTWMKTAARELSFELQSGETTAFSNKSPASNSPAFDGKKSLRPTSPESKPSEKHGSGPATPQSQSGPGSAGASPASDEPIQPVDPPIFGSNQRKPKSVDSPTPLSNVQRLLQEARQNVRRKDAFDPDEFNRRFAGSRTR